MNSFAQRTRRHLTDEELRIDPIVLAIIIAAIKILLPLLIKWIRSWWPYYDKPVAGFALREQLWCKMKWWQRAKVSWILSRTIRRYGGKVTVVELYDAMLMAVFEAGDNELEELIKETQQED